MSDKYVLPHELRQQTFWLVRNYDRLWKKRDEILGRSRRPSDGLPQAKTLRSTVEHAAEDLEPVDAQLVAIEDALERIPPEYRKGVWSHIQECRRPFPDDAGLKTYKKWQRRFLYHVACNMGWWSEKD